MYLLIIKREKKHFNFFIYEKIEKSKKSKK